MFGLNEAQIALLMRTNGIMSDMRSMGAPYIGRFGTFADGDYSPGANATLTKNMYMWRDVNIGADITITVPSPGVLIFARDVTISGLLTASGKGAAGGAAVSASGTSVNGNPGANGGGVIGGDGGDGGYGGAGGKGAFIKNVLIDIFNALSANAGAGGGSGSAFDGTSGAGGAGGGYIFLTCNTLTVNSGGAIRADGINGGNGTGGVGYSGGSGGGGGGGGGIIIVAKNIVNNGNITAAKGLGGIKSNVNFSDGNPGVDGTVLLLEVA